MLKLQNIGKTYQTGTFKQVALKNINLEFREEEFVAILGPSGSGKTTLLNIIGGLDSYDTGDLLIDNKSTKNFKDEDWDSYRNHKVGFIFQNYNLINHLSILANVEMGMLLSGVSLKKCHQVAKDLLEVVGLKEHMHKHPNELSGGQMQRISIIRALANNPDIILADEPTGALDSKTSIQIMELIKKITKNKLVIMVTHNEKLAKTYATRIIKMQDGKVIKDTNPINYAKNIKEYKLKKTFLKISLCLRLSLNNLKTKKGRTFITSFAASIGIIGIALILSLSNGFNNQIKDFEQNTLSSMPIIISKQAQNDTLSLAEEDNSALDSNFLHPLKEDLENIHYNNITTDFLNYLNNIDSSLVRGLAYYHPTKFNFINKIKENVKLINLDNELISLPKCLDNETSVIATKYDILKGKEAIKKDELLLIVDEKNQVSQNILEALGIDKDNQDIKLDDVLNKTIKLVFNDDLYQNIDNYFVINKDLETVYQNSNNLTLKIVGIAKLKEEYASLGTTSLLGFTNDLLKEVIRYNKDSEIVSKQQEVNYNLITGEVFTSKEDKDNLLSSLGGESMPEEIQIYPKDFLAKTKINEYLDKYNQDKDRGSQIIYVDQAKMVVGLSQNIMLAISLVLGAFSAISLVVSALMISIIMYISVLERTKEIGILRSLGARKKDISRIFKMEALLMGVISGILGIILTLIILVPVNQILENLTNLKNIGLLNPWHAFMLISLSAILTLVGGLIPAKIASRQNPVLALRTE